MAIPQSSPPVTIRKMTICNKGFAREKDQYVFFSIISLTGKWLQQHGFKGGQVSILPAKRASWPSLLLKSDGLKGFDTFGLMLLVKTPTTARTPMA